MIRVEAAGRTHVGLVRRRNEDTIHVGRSLFAVADGLGGHVAGDIASATVIDALQAHDRQVDEAELAEAAGRAVRDANDALRRRIKAAPELAGMGSTLVALLRSGTKAAVVNVGDSRAYLLRNGVTLALTEDHTFQHLVADAGRVPDLPERLARWLDGRLDGRSPDIAIRTLRPGDRFLLCSDGLSSYVPYDLIHAALTTSSSPDETADQLVTLAIDQGAPDNVTVIVVDVRNA
jgi:serine/threonine protein phosphatase PrpC